MLLRHRLLRPACLPIPPPGRRVYLTYHQQLTETSIFASWLFLHLSSTLLTMEMSKSENVWERTNVTNLLRNRESGKYYARVKVNGKQKWRTLETKVFSVAKLRLTDTEKAMRAQGMVAKGETDTGHSNETTMARFIAIYRERVNGNSSLAPRSKERADSAVKAIVKTWPELSDQIG